MHPNSRNDALETAAPTPTPHTWASLRSLGRRPRALLSAWNPWAWGLAEPDPTGCKLQGAAWPCFWGCLCGGRKALPAVLLHKHVLVIPNRSRPSVPGGLQPWSEELAGRPRGRDFLVWPRIRRPAGAATRARMPAMEALEDPEQDKGTPLQEVRMAASQALSCPQCCGLSWRSTACGCDQSAQGGEGDADPGPQRSWRRARKG